MESENKGVLLIPEFVEYLEGDLPAAVMLSQLFYWYRPSKNGQSKLRVAKQGSWWVAKSSKEWQQETGMTPKQVRRGLEVLEARGIITTATLRFNGAPTVHCRLVRLGGTRRLVYKPEDVLQVQGQIHLPCGANPSALEGESLTENTAEKTTETTSTPAAWGQGNSPESEQEDKDMNLSETLKAKAGKSPLTLETAWNKYVSQEVEGFQPKITGKELAQLKRVRLWCEEQKVPAVQLIAWLVPKWTSVVGEVKVRAGLKLAPSEPSIGWVSQYIDHVVFLYQEHLKVASTPVESAPVVEKPVPVAPVVAVQEEAPSADQIAEAFAAFGKQG